MEVLKSPTIWESASRPLFVRSIWLEAQKTGRAGPQRHFILDYEPGQRRVQSKSALSSGRNKVHATLQHSKSYDFVGDWQNHNSCGFVEDCPTDLLLIVPAKVEPLPAATAASSVHPQTQQSQLKFPAKPLLPSNRATQRRSTFFFRNHAPRRGPLHELYELYSRHSSLQDLQSTLSQVNSHADERLAERVLNWLDLAGKRIDTHKTKPVDVIEMVKRSKKVSAKVTPSQAPPQVSSSMTSTSKIHRPITTRAQSLTQIQAVAPQPSTAASRGRKHVRYASAMRAEETPIHTTQMMQSRTTDPVKHITIIFDHEGVPVRFNRPVRNIDLSALSTSPATVRRLTGSLSSARLYSEAEKPASNQPAKTKLPKSRPSTDVEYGAYGAKATLKRPHDAGIFDAKKQLHIFMPNLMNKDLLTAVGANASGCDSIDDTLSGLSNTFSEFCKI
ncbi:uncharacterized protein LOC129244710 [Anastrepha obliqua]|uniref:uncharacterized protein LOC129244710 n=1 Tax=Anastrepha obliqua TaxID=95512 RepID=UPI002409BD6A|nr:uncharacterized protein LOC129244710 [Anastrepha obliqua]